MQTGTLERSNFMKPLAFPNSFFVLAVAILPLVNGCVAQSSEAEQVSTNAPILTPGEISDVISAGEESQPAAETAAKAEAAPGAKEQKKLPPNLNLASPSSEVLKLAQAGVDDSVLLAFVTNSTKTFGLGSDEIIYLNDLGVSGNVVTAIMDHDNAMKRIWANAAPAEPAPAAPAPTIDETATAPSYVEPPVAAPVEPQPTTVVNNNYFYDTLSPYGTWIDIDGYGRCWQPTVVVVNRSWQPYCDRGRWVYSDCGWYWLSDYSWGATTFHYGRWFNHSRWGWCWWPDTIWAPSWVTWRYSSDYCGWAPLPPHSYYSAGIGFSYYGSSVGVSFGFGLSSSCYTFVPTSRFCDLRPYHYRAHYSKVGAIYNNTTIINNYGSGNNNYVANRGIEPERLRQVANVDVRQVALRDAPPAAGTPSRAERLDRDGRTLLVSRPQLPANRDGLRGNNVVNSQVTPVQPANLSSASVARPAGVANVKPWEANHTERLRPDLTAGKNPGDSTPPAVTTKPADRVVTAPKFVEPKPVAQTEKNPFHSKGHDLQLSRNQEQASLPLNKERGSAVYGGNRGNASPKPNPQTSAPAAITPTPPAAPAPAKPSPTPSLVVVGRKDAAQPQGNGAFKVFESKPTAPPSSNPSSAQNRSSALNSTPSLPARESSVTPNATPKISSQPEAIRSSRGAEPRVSTPSFPSSAPAQRSVSPSFSGPSPRASAPSPAPSTYRAPVYASPPAASPSPRSQSAPSAPSVSAPRAPIAVPAAPSSSSPSKADSGVQRGRGRN